MEFGKKPLAVLTVGSLLAGGIGGFMLRDSNSNSSQYAEALATQADLVGTGRKFKTGEFDITKVSPVSPAVIRLAAGSMALSAGESHDDPSKKTDAAVACDLAAANGINTGDKSHNDWSAARSAEHSNDDSARKTAEGLYVEAAALCLNSLDSHAKDMSELVVPIDIKND